MKCEKCNENEATVHIKKSVNGVVTEAHLCEECAKLVKGDNLNFIDAADFLSSFFDPFTPGAASGRKSRVCPKCGMSYDEFSRSGYLGCSDCYQNFKDSLTPMLQRMHGKTRHVGKLPKGFDKAIERQKEYEKLKEELKSAIDDERYEEAAKIRDSIKKLEGSEK